MERLWPTEIQPKSLCTDILIRLLGRGYDAIMYRPVRDDARILHVYIRGKNGRGWVSGTGCQWLAGLVCRVCF